MKNKNVSTHEILEAMKTEPYQTVFIIGNGVIKGGWPLFREAVQTGLGGEAYGNAPLHPIAAITFVLRVLAQKNKFEEKGFKEQLGFINAIRTNIFENFSKKDRLKLLITPKKDFVEKLKIGKTVILTTNYDTLLEDYYLSTGHLIVSLHGNVRDAASIYLPTEVVHEPYLNGADESRGYISLTHRVAIEALEHAERVVIWGSSLEVYDAELCVLISESHRTEKGKRRSYIVVDPSREPVKRLNSLLGGVDIQV
jgi:hypothetical protein